MYGWTNYITHTDTTVYRPFVRDYLGRPVPEETFTHSHPSWSSDILYQLPPFTTIHSILCVQFTCLTVLFHSLSPGLLWFSYGVGLSTSYSMHFFTQSSHWSATSFWDYVIINVSLYQYKTLFRSTERQKYMEIYMVEESIQLARKPERWCRNQSHTQSSPWRWMQCSVFTQQFKLLPVSKNSVLKDIKLIAHCKSLGSLWWPCFIFRS